MEQKGGSPKPSLLVTLFGVGHTRPMKGMSAPACSTVPELLDKTADNPKVPPRPETSSDGFEEEGGEKPCDNNTEKSLQEVTDKLRNLEKQVEMNLPTTSIPVIPPVSPTIPLMLNLRKDPILQCWSGVTRDAILEGEWQVTSPLACPVLINNLDAHNWDMIYGRLMIRF